MIYLRSFEHFLLTFRGGVSFVDLFCYLCFVFFMLSCLSIATLWPPAGKSSPLGPLVCDVFFCYSYFHMCCHGAGLVLDCDC